MIKTGIFGGNFDPIHSGHIALAMEAKKELKLKKMMIIPTAVPPHKQGGRTSFEDRYEMCRLAFEGIEGFEVSNIEKVIGGKSYTINTIRALKQICPADTDFYLIIGSDSLFCFEQWYRYEAVLKECHVVAAARDEGCYADMLETANRIGRVRVLNMPVTELSSTELRARLKNGESTEGLMPESVIRYIAERGLYRD